MKETSDADRLFDRLAALETFVETYLPPLIAASSARQQLEAQLQALAGQETGADSDPELHWQADLAERVLSRLQAG